MKFISLFSGIGGFDLGFEQAGMECVAQVELNKDSNFVLNKHWPHVLKLEDVKDAGYSNLPSCDLICGGFPCQDVSVAGNRKGLAGEKSKLWFEFLRILKEIRPQWMVIENVPGLLSSNKGMDFFTILQGLEECGYNVEWRVLDSQYYGVAQRRKRLFIVGYLGERRASEVLLNSKSSSWGHKESRSKKKDTPENFDAGLTKSSTLMGSGAGVARTAGQTYETGFIVYNVTMNDANGRRKDRLDGGLYVNETEKANTLTAKTPGIETTVLEVGKARYLTPVECERLQGFPDGWTEGQKDIKRYQQLGNAVTVPVAKWVAERILECT